MIHLDTDTSIASLNGNPEVAARIHESLPNAAISALVLAELLYGAGKSAGSAGNMAKVRDLTSLLRVVIFDESAALEFSKLKLYLRKIGRPTGEIDALIAATAIAHDAILVIHNRRHFENIDRLRLDDWLV